MGKVWYVARQQFKLILGKRGSLLLMFIMPIAFSFIFGFLNGTYGDEKNSSLSMILVDLDKTTISKEYQKLLENNHSVVWLNKNETEAKKLMDKDNTKGVLIIPEGFQKGIINGDEKEQLILTLKQESPEIKNDIIASYQQLRTIYEIEQNFSNHESVNNLSKVVENINSNRSIVKRDILGDGLIVEKQKAINRNSLGFAIMFLMFTLMSSSAVLLDERTEGTLGRLMTTPTSKITIFIGYILAFFMIGWFQFGILMLVSAFIFGVTWGNVWGAIIFASLLIITFIGLGLMIGGFVKTVKQQQAIGSLIIISTSMLGGVYWPIDIVGDVFKKISLFMPQTWALSGFQDLMVSNSGISEITLQVVIILGFAVVFLGVGLRRFKF
ncbi:ABC transporter permease [Lysinibacillus sp. RC79]|uniref:ABC transporter permease n=1 Tax=Lysinibacillus sp. RC79 TaxID=3156296 RepID=UPI003515F45E